MIKKQQNVGWSNLSIPRLQIKSSQVKIVYYHNYMDIVYIWETETQLGLFVLYFDSYIVIHGNLYAEAPIVSKKKKKNKFASLKFGDGEVISFHIF